MNAAANPTPATSQVASLVYADAFGAEPEHVASARDAARSLGLPAVTPGAAALLYLLARMIGARTAVEIGTGAGASSVALLAGMEPNGILTSIDLEPEHQAAARKVLVAAGVPTRRARLIAGAGLAVLPKLSDGAYDLVLVDGDPLEYVEYVEQAARLLRPGGLLVVNHALAGGAVADPANEDDETVIIREALIATQEMEEFTPVLLPVGDGLLVALRN